MSLEFIDELENKIDSLIGALNHEREHAGNIQNEINEKNGKISELEQENEGLRNEIEGLKNNSSDVQGKFDSAADRIRNLIGKLESVG